MDNSLNYKKTNPMLLLRTSHAESNYFSHEQTFFETYKYFDCVNLY